jgi:hypothetical protein
MVGANTIERVDQPTPAQPTRILLRESFALVARNLGSLTSLVAICMLVYLGVSSLEEYVFKAVHFVYDPAKATDQQFFIREIIGNLDTTIPLIPIWVGIYGVIFAILAKEPNPQSGFSAAWKRFFPAVTLGLITDILAIAIDYGLRKAHVRDDFQVGSITIYLLLTTPLMLSLPAMVGLRMGMWESVVYSLRRFEEAPWTYFGYYIGAMVIAVSGFLACGVGLMITMPVYAAAMAMLISGGSLSRDR